MERYDININDKEKRYRAIYNLVDTCFLALLREYEYWKNDIDKLDEDEQYDISSMLIVDLEKTMVTVANWRKIAIEKLSADKDKIKRLDEKIDKYFKRVIMLYVDIFKLDSYK